VTRINRNFNQCLLRTHNPFNPMKAKHSTQLAWQTTIAVALVLFSSFVAEAQTFSTLKSFGILTNITGLNPQSELVQGLDGTLYGTTPNGEGDVRGTLFKVQTDGSGFTVLRWFTNSSQGMNPHGGLTLLGSVLYGTTQSGGGSGAGTVFKVNTDGTSYTVLKNFTSSDGYYPQAALTLSGSVLYGTTYLGGSSGRGAVFKVNTDGTGYSVLKHFSGTVTNGSGIHTNSDGNYPRSALALSGGVLYGTSSQGGSNGYGTVFSVNTDGTGFTVLKDFNYSSDGGYAYAGVTLSGSVLYGTTYQGGSNNYGTVFRVNTDGTGYTVLKHFNYSQGGYPYAGLMLSGSVLYGTTHHGGSSGYGTVFTMNTNGTGYTVLKHLTSNDGRNPTAGLMLSGSVLYGTTQSGGSSDVGTVFAVNTNGTGHTVLKSFGYSDALNPQAELMLSGDVLYGTTRSGGSWGGGTVFKVNADGTGFAVVKDFNTISNGGYPYAGLVLSGSVLYGTTSQGGSSSAGTVFKMNTDGTGHTVLKNLSYSSDGSSPYASLTLSGGVLYGTAQSGGSAGRGTVFTVNTDGTGYNVLKHFSGTATNSSGIHTNGDGNYPRSALVLAGGVLYGTALQGGSNGYGTVFAVNTDGTGFTVLKHFTGSDGQYPYAGVTLSGSVLYGTTYQGGGSGNGTVFAVGTDGTGFTVLKHFNYSQGGYPYAGLTLLGSVLYGTTQYGGSSGYGTVFTMNTDGTGYTVLKNLTSADGRYPYAGLILGGSTLYGTTEQGGNIGAGVVFKLDLAPVITSQPVSRTNAYATTANFAVSVGGFPTPALQWRSNGTPIPSATNLTYTIPSVVFPDAGDYDVVATNIHGSVTSSVATLTVIKADSTVAVTGSTLFDYTGSPLGPTTADGTGSGGAVTFSYAGTDGTVYGPSATLPSQPGTYTATASVAEDAHYNAAVSVPFAFTIARFATVEVGNLHQHFDGTPKSVTINTSPSGLAVQVAYNGSPTPPSAAGSYEVVATVTEPEYVGGATATLAICDPTIPGYTVLKSFGILTNVTGRNPQSQLVQGPDGTLYGTAPTGEGSVNGTVFKVQPDGSGFTVLKRFTNSLEGASPYGGLTLSSNVLYGTTQNGGSWGAGTVFKVNTDGTSYAVLKSFNYSSDGAYPYAGLTLSGSVLYGTTYQGGSLGYGTLFSVNTDGTGYAVLKVFTGSDGRNPYAGLTLSGSVLYGTTYQGGSNGFGTVFTINTDGTGYTVLKNFENGSDGGRPYAGLTMSGGALYGTTHQGGSNGFGTVFTINTDGTGYTVLKSFTSSDGRYPYAGLTLSGSVLYGTTQSGGSSGLGTVFAMNTDGTGYTVVKNFAGSDGRNPYAGLTLSGSVLYGTTYQGGTSGSGTVFAVNTDGTGYTVLKNFVASNDEQHPYAGLTLSGSVLYGTTYSGGSNNYGTVFKVDMDGAGYAVLKHFNYSQGAYPHAGLTLSGGALYGTTYQGGSNGYGTVFRIDTNGTGYAVLKSFMNSDGRYPYAGLTLSGGMLFGTTYQGGSSGFGTVFAINTDGTGYTVLKHFAGSDGRNPYAALTLSGSALYGTTYQGGSNGYGTVFTINTDGTGHTVLKHFTYNEGGYPYAGLTLSGSVLYGTTQQGGNSGLGTVFAMNTDGTGYTVLKQFTGSDGYYPRAGLSLSGNVLYGTTEYGGSSGYGTVFQVNTGGTGYAVLKHFTGGDGGNPYAALTLSGCTLFGSTYYGGNLGYGAIFAMNLAPVIASQPQSVTAEVGTNVTFAVSAGGGVPLTYQWFKAGAPIGGTTATNYTIGFVQVSDAGNYWVLVSNSYGNATSTVATLTVPGLPQILGQPQSFTASCGTGIANFSVTAAGIEPLAYQWHFNNLPIPGATGTNHTVAPTTPDTAGAYSVAVTNVFGAVTSAVATLTLTNQMPTVAAGDSFSVNPGGPLTIAPSALLGNDVPGQCDGTSMALTFLSFSPTSINGGTLETLPPGLPLWTNRYNGTGNFDDIGEAVAVDGSGNVVVAGKTYESGGSDDYTVIKYSGAGLPLWTNRYNGPTNGSDRAQALAVDAGGTVFVTGYSASGGGNGAFATLAYSSAGEPLWTNRYSAAAGGAQAITLTSSGNAVVTGNGLGGYLTVAYSSGGAFLWARTYNSGGGLQEPKDIAADASGNVFVTGWSGFVYDYATLGYAADGTPLWTNRYNGPGGSYDSAQAVAVDGDGNVFVTGHAFNGTSYDYGTIKYSNSGVPLWTNVYNGPTSDVDRADAMAVDGAGNVFVTGYSGSGGADDFATVAYSTDGTPLWTNRYNGPANSYDAANAVALDGNGNVIVTGHSYGTGETYDYATVAYSGAGVPLWTNRYIGPVDGVDSASAVTVDSAGNVFITGNSAGVAGRDFSTIGYSGSQLLYIPPTNFTGVDAFTYAVQDGYGLTYTGSVAVAVGVVAKKVAAKKLATGEVELGFYGAPGEPYALERVFDLTSDVWTPQQTNTAAANGALSFTNLPVGSANFWRVRAVP
jgi:uncharacterized repeat protein (TIGR03803 family)